MPTREASLIGHRDMSVPDKFLTHPGAKYYYMTYYPKDIQRVEWFDDDDDEWHARYFANMTIATRFFEDQCDKLIESTGIRPANCSLETVPTT
jgi:hypothetical protein